MKSRIKIGDTYFETARVASIVLEIPYATIVKKMQEAKEEGKSLEDKLSETVKVIIDNKPYFSFTKASKDYKIHPAFLRKITPEDKRLNSKEIRDLYYKEKHKSGKEVIIKGVKYDSVVKAGLELGISMPNLYLILQKSKTEEELNERVDKLLEHNKEGKKVEIGNKEYPSIASVSREFNITETMVKKIIKKERDPSKRLEMILKKANPVVKIGNEYCQGKAEIGRLLCIKRSEVEEALEDHYKRSKSWETIKEERAEGQ